MRVQNRQSLESLVLFCHIGGLIIMFLGFLIVGMDLLNNDFSHIQVGIFIFVIGYTYLKISSTIGSILSTETKNDY